MKLFDFFIGVDVRPGRALAALDAIDRKSHASRSALVALGAAASGTNGKLLSLGAGAFALASGIQALVTAGFDYEKNMNSLEAFAVGAGDTEDLKKNLDEIGHMVSELAQDSVFTTADIAGGAAELKRNGITIQDIMNGTLETAVMIAEALGEQMGPSISFVTDVQQQFGLAAQDLPLLGDAIVSAAGRSKFALNDLWHAMANAGAASKNLGVDQYELLEAVVAVADQFKTGRQAGTALKNMFIFSTGKSKKSAALIKELGLEMFKANGELKDMPDLIRELQKGMENLSPKQRQKALHQIFGTDAIRGATGLINMTSEELEGMEERLNDVTAAYGGLSREARDIRHQKAVGAFNLMKAAANSLATTIFNLGLSEALEGMFTSIRDTLNAMNDFAQANPELIQSWVEQAAVAAEFAAVLIGIVASLKLIRGLGSLSGLLKKPAAVAKTGGTAAAAAAGGGAVAAKTVAKRTVSGALVGTALQAGLITAVVKSTGDYLSAKYGNDVSNPDYFDPRNPNGASSQPIPSKDPVERFFSLFGTSIAERAANKQAAEWETALEKREKRRTETQTDRTAFRDFMRGLVGSPLSDGRRLGEGEGRVPEHSTTLLDVLNDLRASVSRGELGNGTAMDRFFARFPEAVQPINNVTVANSMVFNVKSTDAKGAAQEIGNYLTSINGGVTLDGAQ